jgi:PAS domain S-box-containing protein
MRLAPSELARSALEAAPDAMIIIDASGSIRFVNRQVSALFGYEQDEIIGKSIEHLKLNIADDRSPDR